MNPLLNEIVNPKGLEFLTLDHSLRIAQMSEGVSRFAEQHEILTVGADVRNGFPELVGAESELYSMLRHGQGTWHLRGLERCSSNNTSVWISIAIEPLVRPPASDNLLMMVEDITDAMRVEQKILQQSNEALLLLEALSGAKKYLGAIIDSLADALFVTSPEGVLETTNRAATDLFEYNKAELIGRSMESIISSQLLTTEMNGDMSQFPLSVFRSKEVLCRTKSGKEIPVSFSCSVVRDEEGNIRGLLYLGRDIRERKLAEEKIQKLQIENVYLQEEIKAEHNFEEIIGVSTAIKKVFKQIQKVAGTDSTVLLLGETGTGKELIARAIHNLSNRKSNPLIKVNCAALPSGLVESELFGHEKGAFTGASARKMGRFELADGGTLLMDEVGELPLDTQAKFLRVLQEQEFERVGGTQTLRVNVRIIAATNRSLEDAVGIGAFREDLFYRLNVFPMHVPSLRERLEDIPLLTSYFIGKFSQRMSKRIESVSEKGMNILTRYSWPGNVRELASVLERAIILCDGSELKETDLAVPTPEVASMTKTTRLEDIQREHILHVLKQSDGVIDGPRGAAAKLGVNPATLRSRLRKLGIKRSGSTFLSGP